MNKYKLIILLFGLVLLISIWVIFCFLTERYIFMRALMFLAIWIFFSLFEILSGDLDNISNEWLRVLLKSYLYWLSIVVFIIGLVLLIILFANPFVTLLFVTMVDFREVMYVAPICFIGWVAGIYLFRPSLTGKSNNIKLVENINLWNGVVWSGYIQNHFPIWEWILTNNNWIVKTILYPSSHEEVFDPWNTINTILLESWYGLHETELDKEIYGPM